MRLRTKMEHLPSLVQQELRNVTAMLFEAFTETNKGRLSDPYRSGRILALILHGPHASSEAAQAISNEPFTLLAIVNHPRLARYERDWRLVRDRLRRASEFGEIGRAVRLTVESRERVNNALNEGVPHYVEIVTDGIALYQMEGLRLEIPRNLSASERRMRGLDEYARWYERASDFLLGAGFYRELGNKPMAALLLHQGCEHLYQCVLWTLTLHGPRTHSLDELRGAAETISPSLRVAWPRELPFERRAFTRVDRAYVEVRYGRAYRIDSKELAWAMERAAILHNIVRSQCRERLDDMVPATAEFCHG